MAVGAAGVGGLSYATDTASAEVSADFTASGDAATLSDPPASITVSATGEFAAETTASLDQVQITLQAEAFDQLDDLTSMTVIDGATGTYDLRADLLADHRDLEAADFLPVEGESLTTDVRLRVVAAAVQNGEIAAEGAAEATVPVTVNHEGVVVTVGGTGSVTIKSA